MGGALFWSAKAKLQQSTLSLCYLLPDLRDTGTVRVCMNKGNSTENQFLIHRKSLMKRYLNIDNRYIMHLVFIVGNSLNSYRTRGYFQYCAL